MGHEWGGRNRRKDPIERSAHALEEIACTLKAIEGKITAPKPNLASLGLAVTAVHGRSRAMSRVTRPGVEFVDVEKSLLSVTPKDADNRAVPAATVAWNVETSTADDGSSDPVLTLEPGTDDSGNDLPNARWAVSGTPGTANVVASTTLPDGTVLEEEILVTIKVGQASSLNLSAGAPVPE